jgi:hypothetical protein
MTAAILSARAGLLWGRCGVRGTVLGGGRAGRAALVRTGGRGDAVVYESRPPRRPFLIMNP